MHIKRFNWSQKTYSILYKLGIIDTEEFEGVSIKTLHEMGIPKKTIKQIEDICKVRNIETKETKLKMYEYNFQVKIDYKDTMPMKCYKQAIYIASSKEIADNIFKTQWTDISIEDCIISERELKDGMKIL